MRKLVLVLVVALSMVNCTPDDECGTVTDWDLGNEGQHYLWVNGNRHTVNAGTWYEYNIGDSICITY